MLASPDPSVCREAPELVPSFPTISPADILIDAALPGGRTALDIGIATPGTSTVGVDACDSMWSEKIRRYRLAFLEMAAYGIHYTPMIFSCYGRVHLEVASVLVNLAKRAVRGIGCRDWQFVLNRTRASICVILVRRSVVMVRACLKSLSSGVLDLLLGDGLVEA